MLCEGNAERMTFTYALPPQTGIDARQRHEERPILTEGTSGSTIAKRSIHANRRQGSTSMPPMALADEARRSPLTDERAAVHTGLAGQGRRAAAILMGRGPLLGNALTPDKTQIFYTF